MFENLRQYKIVLASKSPRRKQLLGEILGPSLPFEIRTLEGIDESFPEGLSHEETALHIADKKREAFLPTLGAGELLITADTIVCIDGRVLGKPSDEVEAMDMLRLLSGKTHDVVTAVTLTVAPNATTEPDSTLASLSPYGDQGVRGTSFAVTTHVTFATLTDDQIRYYVELFEPLDKAGAYGIQEWIGTVAITSIEGSYQNVVGLPTQKLYQKLAEI